LAGRVTVAANERRVVRWDELALAAAVITRSKGDLEAFGAPQPIATVVVAAGIEGGVANEVGAMPAARVVVRIPSGWSLGLTAGSRRVAGFRATSSALLAGYRF